MEFEIQSLAQINTTVISIMYFAWNKAILMEWEKLRTKIDQNSIASNWLNFPKLWSNLFFGETFVSIYFAMSTFAFNECKIWNMLQFVRGCCLFETTKNEIEWCCLFIFPQMSPWPSTERILFLIFTFHFPYTLAPWAADSNEFYYTFHCTAHNHRKNFFICA